MTTEEAIWAMQFYQEKLYNGIYKQYIGAFDLAIAALRAQQEAEKNEPLTLEELLEMDGEPVYCLSAARPQESKWGIVHRCKTNAYVVGYKSGVTSYFPFTPAGSSWLAYRHKPKED